MKLLEIFKIGTEFVVSTGVSALVGNAIKMTHDPEMGRLKKIAVGIGGFVLASLVSDQATKYTSERIDTIYEKAHNIFLGEETVEVFDLKIIDDTGEGEHPEISISGVITKKTDKPTEDDTKSAKE